MSTSSSRLESQKLIIVVLAVVSGILAVILLFGLVFVLWFCRHRRRQLQNTKIEYYPSKSLNESTAPTTDDFNQARTPVEHSAPQTLHPALRPPLPPGFSSFIASSQALDRPVRTSIEDTATTEGSFLHSPTMSTASNMRGSLPTPSQDAKNNSMRSVNRPPLPGTPKRARLNTPKSAPVGKFDAYHRYLRTEHQKDNEDIPPVPPSRPRTKTPEVQNTAG